MTAVSGAKVVDLAAFKAARDRSRLPLFEADPPVRSPFVDRPAETSPLTDRQAAHRELMLKHLAGVRT